MKKFIALMLFIAVMVIFVPAAGAAGFNYNVVVFVDGEQVDFPDQKPYIDPSADRTYVPIRFVSEALGAEVDWDKEARTVYIKDAQHDISLNVGSYSYFVDSVAKTLDAPPVITGDRTMVPLRFVSEALDKKVDYTPWGAFGRVDIYDPGEKPVIPEPKPNVVQLMDQALGGDYMHLFDPKKDYFGMTGGWVYQSDSILYMYEPPRPDYHGVMGTGSISTKCEAKKVSDNDRIYLRGIAQAFLPDKVDETMDAIDAGINGFKRIANPPEHQIFSKMVKSCIVRPMGDPSGDFVSVYIRLFE